MSIQLIERYYEELEKLVKFGGTAKETTIRPAFISLLNGYAETENHKLLLELPYKLESGKSVVPDGTIKDELRLDWGYWESKDSTADLDEEIKKKFAKGYPRSNILFEDSQTAILYQGGFESLRCPMSNSVALDKLLTQFVSYTRPEVVEFRAALAQFKKDLPSILDALRDMIERQEKENTSFEKAKSEFLDICQKSINSMVTPDDIKEMLIQHILTEDIFTTVFDDPHFHQENNISKELHKLEDTFFTGAVRRNTLDKIADFYRVIRFQAAGIASHTEKQKFLKIVYENFYKAYNPKAADRLGVVYTPNEVVKFMIDGADFLLHRHFGKTFSSRDVEVLDPATGTGTFICDLIEHIPATALQHKYKNEIHANEVAILPYYIANLNIEATFKQKMGFYEEFQNICFVDTLDNVAGLAHKGQQLDMFDLSAINAARIKNQNMRKISVIIGNPPYNAKQANYNYQNANRAYEVIDESIKKTFVKEGTAQNQIVIYDMYTRFYRWAMDRLSENGIIAFITNRSFIDSRTFDGFRKCIQEDFSHAYIIDLHSDVRTNPKIAGTSHNVFGIQTGVAIMFLVKKSQAKANCHIEYFELDDFWKKELKLEWLANNQFKDIPFRVIAPDKKNNWLNITDNDWDELLPLVDKDVKVSADGKAIAVLFSRGVETARDQWVYSFDRQDLINKMSYFCESYNKSVTENEKDMSIKWCATLEQSFSSKIKVEFNKKFIRECLFRPYTKALYYSDKIFSHRLTANHFGFFGLKLDKPNFIIATNALGGNKPFHCLATDAIVDLHATGDSQCLSLYSYDSSGVRVENITDWSLSRFRRQYKDKKISKEDIFNYVYAVLHDPAYLEKYAQNLKRDFPRIPFRDDFHKWAAWGKELMEIHIGYENAKPWDLERADKPSDKKSSQGKLDIGEVAGQQLKEPEGLYFTDAPKTKLKADKAAGAIEIDAVTTLSGIPSQAWEYKLGNRSALEWILDQYKEKKPSDPTIAEKFNNYRFADYKEHVIDLLRRVTTVSVRTTEIVNEMKS